eukprot:scaffold169_cov122-Skeletonema_dohrnii-CCMP3373.AAC.4
MSDNQRIYISVTIPKGNTCGMKLRFRGCVYNPIVEGFNSRGVPSDVKSKIRIGDEVVTFGGFAAKELMIFFCRLSSPNHH